MMGYDITLTFALHKKCPYLGLFCSAFSHIGTEYGEIGSTRITPSTETFHAVLNILQNDLLLLLNADNSDSGNNKNNKNKSY